MKITIFSDKDCKLHYCPGLTAPMILFEDQEQAKKLMLMRDISHVTETLEIDGTIEILDGLTPGWVPTYYNPDNNNLEEPAEPCQYARIVPPKPKEEDKFDPFLVCGPGEKKFKNRLRTNIPIKHQAKFEPKEEPKTHSFHSDPEDLKREKELMTQPDSHWIAATPVPFNAIFNSPETTVHYTQKAVDEFTLGFADYMRSERWRYDHMEEKNHTDLEHLEHYKQSLK